jgi:hypothetical protein
VHFEVNGHVYHHYYLFTNSMHPQKNSFVQMIHKPQEEKRSHFAKMQKQEDKRSHFAKMQKKHAKVWREYLESFNLNGEL